MDNAKGRKLLGNSQLTEVFMGIKLFFFRFLWPLIKFPLFSPDIPFLSKSFAIPTMFMVFPGKFHPLFVQFIHFVIE